MKSLLQIENLSYSYRELKALDGVSFKVDSGELFALIGPNGSGKSTLFKILATLMPIQTGKVSLFGKDITKEATAIRKELGVVFQFPAVDKKLTVLENLQFQKALYGVKTDVAPLLELFQLGPKRDERVEKLSGGMIRRLEIAKALLHEPKFLLMDEPTTGLDPLVRRELWDFLGDLRKKKGLTLFFTTHLLEEAEASDRLVLLDKGKLLAMDSPQALKQTMHKDTIRMTGKGLLSLKDTLESRYSTTTTLVDQELRIESDQAPLLVNKLLTDYPKEIESITISRGSLEEFFIAKTGRRFQEANS